MGRNLEARDQCRESAIANAQNRPVLQSSAGTQRIRGAAAFARIIPLNARADLRWLYFRRTWQFPRSGRPESTVFPEREVGQSQRNFVVLNWPHSKGARVSGLADPDRDRK